MAGLARLCKLYGKIIAGKDKDGKEIIWLYDYANDIPRLQSEMTKEEIAASEKAKWELLKKHL
jgi:hypothetical protein